MQINKKSSGFTLVEVMIAAAISLMVVAGLLSSSMAVLRISKTAEMEAEATRLNVKIRSQMLRELRGVTEVLHRTDTYFHFLSEDINGNEKEIYYKFEDAYGSEKEPSLIRNEVSLSNQDEVLLSASEDGLEAVDFNYYNQMGEVVATVAETNAVEVDIKRSIDVDTALLDRDSSISMIMFRNKIYDL